MKVQALILIVEDEREDVALIRRSLRKAGVTNPCRFVSNSEEAMAYLKGQGEYKDRAEYPLPGLVLLDLKLPGMDGFELLRWVRSQAALKELRVVVVTGSTEIRDVNRAYQLGANSFLTKPLEFDNVSALKLTLEGQQILPAPESAGVAA